MDGYYDSGGEMSLRDILIMKDELQEMGNKVKTLINKDVKTYRSNRDAQGVAKEKP